MFKAELVVSSDSMSLEQITQRIGAAPDGGWERGSIGKFAAAPRAYTSWWLDLESESNVHAGTAGLDRALLALGESFAARVGGLSREGCIVSLKVYQQIDRASSSKGIYLSAASVNWLAICGADIDLDQYIV